MASAARGMPPQHAFLLAAVPMYAAYVIGFAYSRSRTGNLVWNSTRLGPLRFASSLRARGLAKLYLTNALAILCSAGLAIPWAVMRTLRYRVENLRVFHAGALSEFVGGETSAVQAAGAEVGEFFDLDLSL
jgi:uncharacterized membrane protein YjgN (DUF898 family)